MASSSTQHSRTLNLGAQCPEGMVRCEFRLADGSTACYFEIWRCPHCHRQHGLPFIRLCSEHVGQPLCKRWSPKEVTLDFHECFCPAHQAAIRQKELEVWEQRKADEDIEARRQDLSRQDNTSWGKMKRRTSQSFAKFKRSVSGPASTASAMTPSESSSPKSSPIKKAMIKTRKSLKELRSPKEEDEEIPSVPPLPLLSPFHSPSSSVEESTRGLEQGFQSLHMTPIRDQRPTGSRSRLPSSMSPPPSSPPDPFSSDADRGGRAPQSQTVNPAGRSSASISPTANRGGQRGPARRFSEQAQADAGPSSIRAAHNAAIKWDVTPSLVSYFPQPEPELPAPYKGKGKKRLDGPP